jgi:H+/Cl- antiporter ClcA
MLVHTTCWQDAVTAAAAAAAAALGPCLHVPIEVTVTAFEQVVDQRFRLPNIC